MLPVIEFRESNLNADEYNPLFNDEISSFDSNVISELHSIEPRELIKLKFT